MTSVYYAIAGEPHATLPEGVEDWQAGLRYAVLPWRCPQCDQLVAEMVITITKRCMTVLTTGPATRQPNADRDGLPYYGPTKRAMRGKTPRRHPERLAHASFLRARRDPSSSGADYVGNYDPIEHTTFDTICDNCPLRVRIQLPER
ncbi:MAG TPA: hypothetical protein VM305_02105 [Candidatus Limnocylindrales bacterium]|nr:hypothetical protein [Candidatus Limnocylindrales bacterium]